MTNDELKLNFNKTLDLIYCGGNYLDDPNISFMDREAAVPKFKKLLDRANSIIYELKQQGETVTENQMLQGFEIGGDKR